MKKLILSLLIVISLVSCSKQGGQCYRCSFGTVNGYTRTSEVYCGTNPYNFKDAQGNDIPSSCIPK